MSDTRTLTANAMAAHLSKMSGRRVTAKAVRQWARENIARFADDHYTAHAYTAAESRRFESAWRAKVERAKAQGATTAKPSSVAKRSATKRTRQAASAAVAQSAESAE